jgi:hypothetical protein
VGFCPLIPTVYIVSDRVKQNLESFFLAALLAAGADINAKRRGCAEVADVEPFGAVVVVAFEDDATDSGGRGEEDGASVADCGGEIGVRAEKATPSANGVGRGVTDG